jgi:hypothetical protein
MDDPASNFHAVLRYAFEGEIAECAAIRLRILKHSITAYRFS